MKNTQNSFGKLATACVGAMMMLAACSQANGQGDAPKWVAPDDPDWKTSSLPLAAIEIPEMTPPKLKKLEAAPAPLMHWFKGPLEIDGYKAGWFRTRELTIYYVEGPDNGPPLVFFPGQSTPWYEHQKVLGPLSEKFRVFVMEHRGHGFSERSPDGAYRPIDYVRDAVDFIDHVVGEPAIVSGHSLGGTMVIAMADLYADRMIGASIEDAPFFLDKEIREGAALDRMAFEPQRIAGRLHQVEGASPAAIGRALHETAAYLPMKEEAYPNSVEDREYFITQMFGGVERILAPLTPRDRAFYEANWKRYIETGVSGPTKDFFPVAFLDMRLMTPGFKRVDWRTSVPQSIGAWHDGFDERRGFSRMAVPTLHWHADRRLTPMHTDALIEEAQSIRQALDEPYTYVEALGCQHSIHASCPERFVEEMVKVFGEVRRAPRFE